MLRRLKFVALLYLIASFDVIIERVEATNTVDECFEPVPLSLLKATPSQPKPNPQNDASRDVRLHDDARFVFIVASSNNADWYERNLDSIFGQTYTNYHIIYSDDVSTDGTADLVEAYAKKMGKSDKITVLRNKEHLWQAGNRYRAIHMCKPADICLELDGDDWLPDNEVLAFYNDVYKDPNVWVTYGQYVTWPDMRKGKSEAIPKAIIEANAFRSYKWVVLAMRTCYAWLFQRIAEEDFKYKGNFLITASDLAMMFPLVEMAGARSKFIARLTYVYNTATPISDTKIRRDEQAMCARYIRSLPRYPLITENPVLQLRRTTVA